MSQAPHLRLRPGSGDPRGRVTVYNETVSPIAIVRPGRSDLALPAGAHACLAIAGERTVAIRVGMRTRHYGLDFGLLGFDTIHVRHEDALATAG